ncbi:interferon-induced protein with tetratricopeptide repeats 8 [Anguilla rostrata]|uniref:interferon-induced protein with tetratricopeptide repeats 8 n=1 Tax=Anguilla rostrata TaxID=7938 RepID=UPI0030D46948
MSVENLRSDMEKLECHFTWGLSAEEADLNLLEVKFWDIVSLPQDTEYNLKGRTYDHLAYVKHLQGFNQEALGCLAKAEEENVDNAKHCIVTYGNFAWLHHLMGDDPKAQMYLQKLEGINKSVQTHPLAALPREVLGEKAWSLLKFSKNHYEKAKECFYEALQKEPDDKEWNTGYAFALFRWNGSRIMRGEASWSGSGSVKQLEKALALDPDNGMIMVYLAHIFNNNDRKLEAWAYMRKALDVSPNNLSVVLKVGKYMRKVKYYDMALDVLNRMLKIAPNSPRLHHEIASNYRWSSFRVGGETRDRDLILRSISHTEEEVRLNPSYLYPKMELALRYAEVQNMEKAERIFQEMLARSNLKPTDQQALHRMYGDFHKNHRGSMRTAVTHYMKGMELQNISTDWKICRKRLLKIHATRRTRGTMYFEIEEFLFSFQRNSF